MGMRMPRTCWAVFKRQAINLRDWCIWFIDLFKFNFYLWSWWQEVPLLLSSFSYTEGLQGHHWVLLLASPCSWQ
jgi:hypothetical protein